MTTKSDNQEGGQASHRNIGIFFLGIALILVILMTWGLLGAKSSPTGFATSTGNISICINRQPTLNLSGCNATTVQHELYNCTVSSTDSDSNTLVFSDNTTLFNISQSGLINVTPDLESQLGNYSINITVDDQTGCSNSQASSILNLTILDANDPPELVAAIPNQTFTTAGTVISATLDRFDLDDYFIDPNGDDLSYSYQFVSNAGIVTLEIVENNVARFTLREGLTGVGKIVFFAHDTSHETQSNIVTVNITEVPVETPPPSSTGGGGGSPLFLKGQQKKQEPACEEKWTCKRWSTCTGTFQIRSCIDENTCNTTWNIPPVRRKCTLCDNGIKDPREDDVDCGGGCTPCPSCSDGIRNQDEIDIDCGGVCNECQMTCYDGMRNQGEDEVDCGGPCKSCSVASPELQIEQPSGTFNFAWLFWLILLLILGVLLAVGGRAVVRTLKSRKTRKVVQHQEPEASEAYTHSMAGDHYHDYSEKIRHLERDIHTRTPTTLLKELNAIILGYFRDAFNLSYEPSYNELVQETDKQPFKHATKTNLKSYFERLSEIEFSTKEVTPIDVKMYTKELKELMRHAKLKPRNMTQHESGEKPPFISFIKRPIIIPRLSSYFAKMRPKPKMERYIQETHQAIHGEQLALAKQSYKKLLDHYNGLPAEEQERLYHKIQEMHDEIKLLHLKETYLGGGIS
ncbi:hypothetical protein HZB01_00645 [Candidatus Woesearchaeota archaeon]|nr:hypothetical protein [Candidatus Woesearchaeota archaeon]